MKRNRNYMNKVKVTGCNTINFINNCVSSGLKLNNLNRTSSKEFTFEITDKDYEYLSKIDNRGCNISILELGGKKKFVKGFVYRIGLVIGVIISLIGILLLDNRLLQIHILGLSRTNKETVLECLENKGVTKLSYMNYDVKKLETELSDEFKFSLVSIIVKGNSLIINIKEELPDLENSYAPITADYNMVINSINVYSGTPVVKEGSIVYKGDILVQPYLKKGDSIVYVTPTAEIEASVFFSNSYVFKNYEEVFVRTGKKEIINSEVKLGVFNISNKAKSSKYANYEVEQQNRLVSLYLVPISINKTYAYEVEKNSISRNFDEEKDDIIDRQKKLLYASVPDGIEIKSEQVKVTPIENGNIINIYLMSTIYLKYS